MKIRQGLFSDMEEMQQLFADTVSCICKADYNETQINVWVSGIENKKRWADIIENQLVWVSYKNEKITGFITLANGNYIDFLYVHKNYQRQGIARKLYQLVEAEAQKQGENHFTSDVSKTACPFFESVGFNVIKEQTFEKKGVLMTNFKMAKQIR